MSYIETANTKLSLSVFIGISEALEVQTDALLYDAPRDTTTHAASEITAIIESRDTAQARIITDIVKATKQSLDAYL